MARSVSTKGIRELQTTLNGLVKSMSSDARIGAQKNVYDVLMDAGNMLKSEVKSEATAKALPDSVINSVFSFSDPTKDKPGKSRALVGVNKRKTLLTWTAGQHPKSPRAKVSPGGKVSESRAAMYELGTSRNAPRPFFTPALSRVRRRLVDKISSGLKGIVEGIKTT